VYLRVHSFAAETTVSLELRDGRRRVWTERAVLRHEDTLTGDPFSSARFTWKNRSVPEGERLRLVVKVEALDERITRELSVRAP
jgi:hypothetical protein